MSDFNTTGTAVLTVATTSNTVALPANVNSAPSSTKMFVSNWSNANVYLTLGSSGVTASVGTGYVVMMKSTRAINLANATHVAYIGDSGGYNQFSIETGY